MKRRIDEDGIENDRVMDRLLYLNLVKYRIICRKENYVCMYSLFGEENWFFIKMDKNLVLDLLICLKI